MICAVCLLLSFTAFWQQFLVTDINAEKEMVMVVIFYQLHSLLISVSFNLLIVVYAIW